MEYRRLGKAGIRVSALSFGSWITFGTKLDVAGATECIRTAFDEGVNFFDNAEAYADGMSESLMGKAIDGLPRQELVVSTKLFWGGDGINQTGLSRKHLMEGIDASLQRLNLDYVDLLYCHRPDPETPIEETVLAMDTIVRSGKALYWGTSEWSADEIKEAISVAREWRAIAPSMEQPQYSMLVRDRFEREYRPLWRDYGYGSTIWSPLASGLLTGKYNDGIPDGSRLSHQGWLRDMFNKNEMLGQATLSKVRQLGELASGLGCTQSQLAIAWCLKNPDVSSVITGASGVEQLRENLGAMEVVAQMTDEVMERIESILENRPA